MGDRKAEIEGLAATLREYDVVTDVWLVKSFIDRLLVVDLREEAALPDEIEELLAEHDLSGSKRVYDTGINEQSFVGTVGGVTRHQFVDVQTRGEYQSSVVE